MDHPPTLRASLPRPGQLASPADLAAIPEEEIWLASQKSARTRRAYKQDVAHLMRTLGITTPDQLRQVDHRAVPVIVTHPRPSSITAGDTTRRKPRAFLRPTD